MLPEPFFILTGFSTFQALPLPGNHSLPLTKGSAGLTPGEGGSVMVLKRYDDAVGDGDFIYGTLLGVGLNNAGAGLPLKPNPPSQRRCLSETYERICVKPSSVQYVECHATGTPQGDQAEVDAMKHLFGDNCPRFGSTNREILATRLWPPVSPGWRSFSEHDPWRDPRHPVRGQGSH